MLMLFSTLISVLLVGLGVGGLLVSKRSAPTKIQLYFFILSFWFTTYIGMGLGNSLFSFFSLRAIDIITALYIIGFIALAVVSTHPLHDYALERHKQVAGLLIMFFLVGIEWSVMGHSYLFTIAGATVFGVTLFIGLILQVTLLRKAWRIRAIAFAPLLPLFLLSIVKLF